MQDQEKGEIQPQFGCVWFLGSVIIAGTTVLLLLYSQTLPREGALRAGIFIFAALLWMTEALPLFTTSLLVIGLQILLPANPGAWAGLGFEARAAPGYREILAAATDPVLALFFGGPVLAAAGSRSPHSSMGRGDAK